MLRVQPGDAANSMLMRKLLGGDPHADSDEPTANLAIPGRRMPLYEAACSGQLLPPDPADYFFTTAQIQLVQDWIDEGAAVQ